MNIEENKRLDERMGSLFYAMLSAMTDEGMKRDEFSEEEKKSMFEVTMRNFKDLSETEKKYYVISAYYALKEGSSMLGTLLYIQPKERKGREK
jgi:hypothetical protein